MEYSVKIKREMKSVGNGLKTVGQGFIFIILYVLQLCTNLAAEAIVSFALKLNLKVEEMEQSRENNVEEATAETVEEVDAVDSEESEESDEAMYVDEEDEVGFVDKCKDFIGGVVEGACSAFETAKDFVVTSFENVSELAVGCFETVSKFASKSYKFVREIPKTVVKAVVKSYNVVKLTGLKNLDSVVSLCMNRCKELDVKLQKSILACNAKLQVEKMANIDDSNLHEGCDKSTACCT